LDAGAGGVLARLDIIVVDVGLAVFCFAISVSVGKLGTAGGGFLRVGSYPTYSVSSGRDMVIT